MVKPGALNILNVSKDMFCLIGEILFMFMLNFSKYVFMLNMSNGVFTF